MSSIAFALPKIPKTKGVIVQLDPLLVEAAEQSVAYIMKQIADGEWICVSLLPDVLREHLESKRIESSSNFNALRQLFGQTILSEQHKTLMDELDKLHIKVLQMLRSEAGPAEARKLHNSLLGAIQLCFAHCADLNGLQRWRSEVVERILINYFRTLALLTQTHACCNERDLAKNWKEINNGPSFMQVMGVFHGEACEKAVDQLDLQYLDIHLKDDGIKPACELFLRLRELSIFFETYGKGDDTSDKDFEFATELQMQAIVFGLEHDQWKLLKSMVPFAKGKNVAERSRIMMFGDGPVSLKKMRGDRLRTSVCSNCAAGTSAYNVGEALSACGYCHAASYCNSKCQKEAWAKGHRERCGRASAPVLSYR